MQRSLTDSGGDASGGGASDGESARTAARGFVFTATVLLVGGLITLAAQLGLPGLTAAGPTYRTVWPQGWAFFSDAPRSEVVTAYQIGQPAGTLPVLNTRQTAAGELWGLRRVGYSQIAELNAIRGAVPATAWIACGTPGVCSDQVAAGNGLVVRNASRYPTICGSVALTRAPAGLAGRGAAEDLRAESVDLAVVEVAC